MEGSSVKKGMFAVYQKKNDYYFEVPTSLLGRDLLVVNKLQRVPAELNDAGVNRGVNYENQMICMEWDKATGKLMFRQQRPLPLAPQTDAIFRSVKDNFISPLIAAFKIEANGEPKLETGVKFLFLPVLLSAASTISLKFEKYHHGLKYHGGIFYFLPPKKRPQK